MPNDQTYTLDDVRAAYLRGVRERDLAAVGAAVHVRPREERTPGSLPVIYLDGACRLTMRAAEALDRHYPKPVTYRRAQDPYHPTANWKWSAIPTVANPNAPLAIAKVAEDGVFMAWYRNVIGAYPLTRERAALFADLLTNPADRGSDA
jgi:hypothetical protein